MSEGYQLSDAGLRFGSHEILRGLTLSAPDARVLAIVGPSGVGKSSLLRGLAGAALEGLSRVGEWHLFGQPTASWDPAQISFEPQVRQGDERERLERIAARQARVLLLDEPMGRGGDADLMARYRDLLQRQRSLGLAVVVSHNLEVVRTVADDVALLCAGRMDCCLDARSFFHAPPTPLAAQFVRQGNCWPRSTLPSHFHWIRDGLAGMGRPGLLNDIEQDLAALNGEGIDVLVSLTERRIPQELLTPHGITGRHLPIRDMGVPALNAAAATCREVQRSIESGSRVVFHCDAGLGRTGTMLASYLVWCGDTAEDAVEQVRQRIRGAIQTQAQLAFVQRFAETFGRSAR